MRVLLVAHRYPPDGTAGVERSTEALARGLAAAGDAVHVVSHREAAPGTPTVARHDTDGAGTAVTRIVTGPRSLDQHLRGAEETLRAFSDVVLRERPDIVHVQHVLFLTPRLIDVAQRLGAAVVVTFHDFYFACPVVHLQKLDGRLCAGPRGGVECATTCFAAEPGWPLVRWALRTAYFRRVLGLADALVAPSRWMAERMEELVGLGPVEAVPHGIAPPALPPVPQADGRPDRPLVLATLGTLVEHKGLDMIPDALRHAGAALGPVELRVAGAVGNAGFSDHLRARLEAVEGVRTRFLGPYGPADLDWILDGADALLVPSIVPETFSLVAREALVRGVPVIASRIGALEDAVDHDVNGLLVAPAVPADLAHALLRLSADPGLRARLRAGARASEVPGPAAHVQALHAVYERALGNRLSAGPLRTAVAEELDALEAAQAGLGFAG